MSPVLVGWKAKLLYSPGGAGDFEVIGEAESVSFDIDMDVMDYFAIGKKEPLAIEAGGVTCSGTIDKAWVDTKMLQLIYGTPTEKLPVRFHIYAYQNVSGGPHIYFWNCYAESVSVDIPADGFMTESIDFRAEYFEYG